MSHPRRRPFAVARDRLSRHPLLLPLAILAAAAAFRFYNLNWDNGQLLHPDERGIIMLITGSNNAGHPLAWPSSLSQFFDTRVGVGSPLDPHYFAYGSLPYYLLAFLAGAISFLGQHIPLLSQWSHVDTYGGLPLLARGLSAVLDLISVGVVFLIARRIYGYWTAVLAMALMAFTVLDVQMAHFFQVDSLLLPLALLTVLAAIIIVQTNARSAYVWGGIALGAALATKTTALLLVIPLGAAAILAAWYQAGGEGIPHDDGTSEVRATPPGMAGRAPNPAWAWAVRQYSRVGVGLNGNLQWLLGSYAIAALAFALLDPYAILERHTLVADVAQQSQLLVTNNPPFGAPYTIQYAGTLPYLYQLTNLLFWCMGIPLALAAFAGALFALVRNIGFKVRPAEAVLLLWVLPYFLFVGRFFAKFNRYMLPITPILTILGAAFLVWLIGRSRGRFRVLSWSVLAAVTVLSFLYALAYLNIYEHPNTRVAASRWIYAHVPAGTTIATEGAWDDTLPLPVDGHSALIYRQAGLDPRNPGLNLYNPDDQAKINNIADVLTRAKYIFMSSERMIGSIPKLPQQYPITTRYYQLLLAGRLNFRLVKVFQQHPQLGPIVVHDYPADESFHVYDHPIVRIFERVAPITPARVQALLTSGTPSSPSVASRGDLRSPAPASTTQTDTRLMLSQKQWKADQQGPTMNQMFPPGGFAMKHPILVWLILLELLGLLAFPMVFLLLGNLLDRGWVIAKTLGLLILGYAVWIVVRLGAGTFDRGLIVVLLCAFAVASALLAFRLRAELAAFLRQEWKRVLAGELVFLAGFALFILLRMWYPDLGHQFSPVSPSNIGDGRMGEKQMELAFLNAIVRSRVFPPFDPFFAHGYINYYYYGFFLVGMLCKLTAIVPATGFNLAIATFFALLVGNVFSVGLSLTRRFGPGILAALFVGVWGNLNGAWQVVRDLTAVAAVHSSIPLLGGVMDVLSGLQQVLVHHVAPPPFDYWESTRIVPPVGGPITEFPYFTYLFADLHPHLMAYPMTAAALGLAVSLLLGSYSRRLYVALSVLLGGVLMGAIAVTNPWDFPTYLLVVGLGALVGAYAVRRRFARRDLTRPVLWMGGLGIASIVLYLPFKQDYQTVFTTGIGLVRDITPAVLGNPSPAEARDDLVTPLRIYLEHFGFFVFAIASFLVFLLLVEAGLVRRARRWLTAAQFALYYRERAGRLWHATRIARRMTRRREPVVDGSILVGFGILVGGLLVLQYFLLAFLAALLGLVLLLLLRLGREMSGAQLFLLALISVPILLSAGTQVFFIKDWLAGGSDFRMNTIFKFYNQAWVLFATCAAVALYFFMARRMPLTPPTPSPSEGRGGVPGTRSGEILPSPPPGQGGTGLQEEGSGMRGAQPLLVAAAPTVTVAYSSGASEVGGRGMTGGRALPVERVPHLRGSWPKPLQRPLALLQLHPIWGFCLALLTVCSLIYTYAGTVSRETYRQAWLPENSVPFTLDGMAFMKVAYPADYAGIQWLNAHVHGAQIVAEADDAYYNWKSRVSMFTGLPDIFNGIHEGEQRYGDELAGRADDVKTLYSTSDPSIAWRIIRTHGVRYIFVGFSERQCAHNGYEVQCYPKTGLAKFDRMVGHGLKVVFQQPGITIYQVTQA